MISPKLAGFVVVLVLDKKPIHDNEDEDDKEVIRPVSMNPACGVVARSAKPQTSEPLSKYFSGLN